MKRLLLFLLLFVLPVVSYGQDTSIAYTKLGLSPTGRGGFGHYTSGTYDSAMAVLKSTGKISGIYVYEAREIVTVTTGSRIIDKYELSSNALFPYMVANTLLNASVVDGVVLFPTAFSDTGIAIPLSVDYGGSGDTTLTNHGLLIGQGTSAFAAMSAGTANQIVTSGGASADPSWTATPTLTSETLTATTNQVVLGTTRTVTISASQPASASRVYTIPDQGAAANFVMSAAAQTVAGVTTFGAGVPITATTNQLILGGASHLLTISSPAIAAASATYTIPDVKKAGTFTMAVAVPDSATAVGVAGAIAYDTSYLYICVTSGAAGSAAWKRASISW